MCAGDQVIVFDDQVMHRGHRQIEHEAFPVSAVIEGDVQPGLGAGVEKTRSGRISPDDAGEVIVEDAVVDALPGLTIVGGFVEVRLVIVLFIACSGHVDGSRISGGRFDAADQGPLRQGFGGDILPALAAIFRKVNQAIIGTGPENPRLVRRFDEGKDGGEGFRPQ